MQHTSNEAGRFSQVLTLLTSVPDNQSTRSVVGLHRDIRSFLAGTVEATLAIQYGPLLFPYVTLALTQQCVILGGFECPAVVHLQQRTVSATAIIRLPSTSFSLHPVFSAVLPCDPQRHTA